MNDGMSVSYQLDSEVSTELDLALRGLLSTCFTQPQDAVFRDRRFFNEPPKHRWIVANADGALMAQLALHEKEISHAGGTDRIGGIAEVCVHPDARGQGLVKTLITNAHDLMRAHGIPYSVLFGNPLYYSSSGYVTVENLCLDGQPAQWVMAAQLSEKSWPSGRVDLRGPIF